MLKSTASEITVFTDYKNLEYFATTKVLTSRQARSAEHLAKYNLKVVYRPRNKNARADMLSRRWDYASLGGSEAPQMSFFKPEQLVLDTAVVAGARVVHLGDTFSEITLEVAEADAQWLATRQAVLEEIPNVAKLFEVHDKFLRFENRWVVPNDSERLGNTVSNTSKKS
jgi:hypothetical protein